MFNGVDSAPYIQTIEDGYTSEIIYSVRLRKKRTISTLFAQTDETIIIKKTAVKDFLSGQYVITENGRRKMYEHSLDFNRAFFSCQLHIAAEYLHSAEYTISAKAEADIIVRPHPLSMLDMFMTSEKTVTGWVKLGN